MDLNLNPAPEPKCMHCGKRKGSHKATTLNCPYNEIRRGFANFRPDVFFEEKVKKNGNAKD